MKRSALPFLALLFLLIGACGKDDKGQEASEETGDTPATTYDCKIIIKPAGEPLKVRASAPTKEEAWTAVCEELPEDRREACRDEEAFSPQIATATMNGEETKTITLKEKLPQHEAKATSEESKDDACSKATLAACKSAGAEGDCVASGDYEETGRMASSTSM